MNQTMNTVTNPYPERQATAAAMNCWGCYTVLWRKEQTERYLCDECHKAGLTAVDETETDSVRKLRKLKARITR